MSVDDEIPAGIGTIAAMAVHVDASLPVHPLTVDDLAAMVAAGILGEDDRVELLDGVLIEMSPHGEPHMYAIRRFTALAMPAVAAAEMELSPQCPLGVRSPISQPEPDFAVIPRTPRTAKPADAVLVLEISSSSRAIDLGVKAAVYARADIPEYWVLDVERRELIVHREPRDGRYSSVRTLGEHDTSRRSPSTSRCRCPSCSESWAYARRWQTGVTGIAALPADSPQKIGDV